MTLEINKYGEVVGGATISRKALIKLAFKAIKKSETPVSTADRKHLLYAACTMDRVALGTWAIDNTCGCLVGTELLSRGFDYVNVEHQVEDSPLRAVGIEFDNLLIDHLTKKYGLPNDGYFSTQAVKVTG